MFHPLWHYLFDALAYGASALIFRAQLRTSQRVHPALENRKYWWSLLAGGLGGAYFFGTWNLSLAHSFQLGHSVAGAIAGGVLGAEAFKLATGARGSTGAVFVLPLSAGIAIGRWGCFFAGVEDRTFGVPGSLPWAVDFGDRISRHPVQAYESLGMAIFFFCALALRRHRPDFFFRKGFHLFVLFYAAQRFLWEFLKPYDTVFWNLNLFHLLCLALLAYAAWMLLRPDARQPDHQP